MKKRYVEIGIEVMESVAKFRGDDDAARLDEIRLRFATLLALADISKQLEEIGNWLHSIRSDGIGVGGGWVE